MRYLGLDFGDKTIGLALASPDGRIATGLTTLRRSDPAALRPSIRQLGEYIALYGITHAVLGFPKHMDGSLSERCMVTQAFADKLQRNFKRLQIILWDERLSTQAVARMYEGDRTRYKDKVDEMAAVYILQGYLDSQKEKKMEF